MSQNDKYREIYNKEIIGRGRSIVFSYEPFSDKFIFVPFSHNVGETAVEDLGKLMRYNLLFYAFGENEVVRYYEDDTFSTLQESAKYAFRQRFYNFGLFGHDFNKSIVVSLKAITDSSEKSGFD